MSQELSRQEIWEIKRVSRELGERMFLNEEIGETLDKMIKDWGSYNFVGTSPGKILQLLKKLKQSEQFLKTLGNMKEPKLLAQTIESILILLKIENPNFDPQRTASILRSELARDSKDIEELLKKIKEKEEKEKGSKQEKKEEAQAQFEKAEAKKNKMSYSDVQASKFVNQGWSQGPENLATGMKFKFESLETNKNLLSEVFIRKLMNKLVLK